MRPSSRSLAIAAAALLVLAPTARGQGVGPVPPALGPSGAGVTAISLGATAGLVGGGLLIASLDGHPSTAATPVGIVLVASGVLLGSSAGNVAVGGYRDALIGTGLRLAGGAALVGGAAATSCEFSGSCSGATSAAAYSLVAAGTLLYVAGVGYDLVTASRNARRARAGRASGFAVGPSYDVATGSPIVALRVGL